MKKEEKKATKVPRDELGDLEIKSDLSAAEMNDYLRRWQHTYVFHFFDETRQGYYPLFDLFDNKDEMLKKARLLPDFAEVNLFQTPEKPDAQDFDHHNQLLFFYTTYLYE